jgi:hypothetical protein
MSLLKHWEDVVRANGYDKLSAADLTVLKNVYFTGAVAVYAELGAGNEREIKAELKEFTSERRSLRVPDSDKPLH